MLLFEELKEKLKKVDEVTLIEQLEITSDEIVDRFEDKIEDRLDKFNDEFGEEELG